MPAANSADSPPEGDQVEAFAARLVRLMDERRMSGVELGRRMAVPPETISHWRSGKRQPSRKNLAALANALGVPAAALAYGQPADATAPAAETATGAGLTEFQRGVLYAARAMSQRVTDLLDEALGAAAGPYRPPMVGNGGVLSPRPGDEARRAAGE